MAARMFLELANRRVDDDDKDDIVDGDDILDVVIVPPK